jgi:hypothetical protein
MIIKMYWEQCHDFVVDDEGAFLLEADAAEAAEKLVPKLSPQERVKFDQMKDIYVATGSNGKARAGCYYFLVSSDTKELKFESAVVLSSDLSSRAASVKFLPDIQVGGVDDIDAINPAAY